MDLQRFKSHERIVSMRTAPCAAAHHPVPIGGVKLYFTAVHHLRHKPSLKPPDSRQAQRNTCLIDQQQPRLWPLDFPLSGSI